MKKGTVLIVAFTFVLSVVLVGIFGMKIMSYDTRTYVEKITPTNVTASVNISGLKIRAAKDEQGNELAGKYNVIVPYSEGLIVYIDYEIFPADATDKNVTVTAAKQGSVEVDGLSVKLLKQDSTPLYYRAADGSNVEIQITLQAVSRDFYYKT